MRFVATRSGAAAATASRIAVAAIERPADLGLPDGRADDPGGGPQRVELRPGPVALLVGVVVADVAPPAAADRDRGHDDRADARRASSEDPLLGGQVAGGGPATRWPAASSRSQRGK